MCNICVVPYALPGTTKHPYSSDDLPRALINPRRIASPLCNPAVLLKPVLDPSGQSSDPKRLVDDLGIVLQAMRCTHVSRYV